MGHDRCGDVTTVLILVTSDRESEDSVPDSLSSRTVVDVPVHGVAVEDRKGGRSKVVDDRRIVRLSVRSALLDAVSAATVWK